MTNENPELNLDQSVIDEYIRLRENETDRQTYLSKIFYFEKIFPTVKPYLEALPEHREHRNLGCHTLISTMGFSPETTASAVAILKPTRLIVAYSAEAERSTDIALHHMVVHRLVGAMALTPVSVDAFDTHDIYNKLLKAYQASLSEPSALAGRMVVDITGGTKLMSATAACFAWEFNLTMCYLDGQWDPRRGVAGLRKVSRMMLIENPSKQRGLALRRHALEHYRQRNFRAAADEFRASRSNIDRDSEIDWLGLVLSEGYRAMADFDLPALRTAVATLRNDLLTAGSVRSFLNVRLADLQARVAQLESLLESRRLSRIASFLALSQNYRAQGRHDFSVLLSYRALEELLREGAVRSPHLGTLDVNSANYEHVTIERLAERFVDLAGFPLGAPGEPIGAVQLFVLLCLARAIPVPVAGGDPPSPTASQGAGVDEERRIDQKYRQLVMHFRNLASLRNRSILVHGYLPLRATDSETLHADLLRLAPLLLQTDDAAFQLSRALLEPFDLERFAGQEPTQP